MRKLRKPFSVVLLVAASCIQAPSPDELATAQAAVTTVLIPTQSTWKYLDNGTNQGTAWTATSFDDSAWKSGPAELGYGDNDEQTRISYGPTPSNRYITTYFRRSFTLSDPQTLTQPTVRVRRDDGAVVYVNGVEVFRTSMPSGAIAYTTLAQCASDERSLFPQVFSPSLLVAGKNVVSVEVHQCSKSSSDLSFDLELSATSANACTPTTCLAQGKNCGSLSDGCGGTLQCGTCPSPQTCGGGGVTNVCGGSTAPSDVLFVGAGDLANSGSNDEATAKLLDGLFANGANANGVVFTLGDNAYSDGSTADYANYYDPTWGRHKARTRPAPGNHDYHITNAADYFTYFGTQFGTRMSSGTLAGYYSYNLGAWHIIMLDSNVSMSVGSDQEKWLRADLAANSTWCTLAAWHRPRYSSGYHGSSTAPQPLYQALYDYNADLILVGHDHMYERFAPMDAKGVLDPARGIPQFVIGTGGASLYAWSTLQPNSLARNNTVHGVVRFTLRATGADWEFHPIATKSYSDSGTLGCH